MTGRGEQRGAAAAALFLLLALGVHAQFLLAARDLGLLRGARIRFGDVVVDDAAAAWARVRASPLAAVPLTTVAEAKTMRWAKARASDETEVSVALVLHHGEWRVVEANLTGIEVETVLRRGPTVDAMTFNIRNGLANDGKDSWPFRKDMVTGLIADYAPVVVGMQEVYHFQLEQLLEALPSYSHVGVGRDDGAEEGEYSCILYDHTTLSVISSGTFWFCDAPNEPGCTSYGNTIPRICSWGHFANRATGETFLHYNVHMDHASQASREASVDQLLDHVASAALPLGVLTMVTGDFNCVSEQSPEIEAMRAFGFHDSFRVLYPNATNVGTFNGFNGDATGTKIDFVWVYGNRTTVTAASIIHDNDEGRYPSDHFPVDATVRFD